MMTALLILHGLIAVALLGAVTHQALAVSVRRTESAHALVHARVSAPPNAGAYGTPVVVLYIAAMAWARFVIHAIGFVVRPLLQTLDLRGAKRRLRVEGTFFRHRLMLLPAYWASWKQPLAAEYQSSRLWLTWIDRAGGVVEFPRRPIARGHQGAVPMKVRCP